MARLLTFLLTILIPVGLFGQGVLDPRLLKQSGAVTGSSLNWDGFKWKASPQGSIQASHLTFTRTNGTDASPVTSLATAGVQSVTLTHCPVGVAGDNTGHSVYISGGTGTAEAVLITGGTCTSGALSGTIFFTTANTHTGAWTITSATDGIQEAVYSMSRPSVFVAPGTHVIYATITPVVGAEIFGAGWSSTLQIGTAGMTLIKADSLDSFSDVYIHDLYLAGNSGNTSEKGIHIKQMSGARVERIKADSVYRAIFYDRVHESSISDTFLLNNSSIYVGSTVSGGATDFSFQTYITNITHYATLSELVIPEVIYLEHAAVATVRGLKIRSCRYDCAGIRIAGGSEGIILDDVTIVQPTYGIQLESTSSPTRFPFFTNISRCQIDQAAIIGINLVDGTQTTIENCSITGRNDDAGYPDDPSYGILAGDAVHALIIQNNKFQNYYSGTLIQLTNGNVDTAIINNYFSNSAGTTAGILVGVDGSAVNNKITVRGNHFGNSDASPIKIGCQSQLEDIDIKDNLGIDEQNGPDITVSGSDQTIQIYNPIHVVTGTGSIQTINQSSYFRTREFKLIPSGASSLTMTTGGNIGFATTLSPGKVVTMLYNRADDKWYPSY